MRTTKAHDLNKALGFRVVRRAMIPRVLKEQRT
jgi:hypothetical protein